MVRPEVTYQRRRISAERYEELCSLPQEELFDRLAKEYLLWETPFTRLLDNRNSPNYRWFVGGQLDICRNILGRHLDTDRRNKAALIWRGVNGEERTLTYHTLHFEVECLASALLKLGIRKGENILLFMPDVPEMIIGMLAAAKVGAVHVAYHMSYSSESLAERLLHCRARFIITSDGTHHGTRSLKDVVDEALYKIDYDVEACVVVERTGQRVSMKPKRDFWYHNLINDPEFSASKDINCLRDSEEPLFMLYTSTNSPEPKAVLHTIAGYLLWARFSTELLFDLDEQDTFWNTADLAWITGHTYSVYGPLSLGATLFIYEGGITYENSRDFFDFLDRYHVTVLYTNPNLLRSVMRAKSTRRYLNRRSNSLRLIGCGGASMPEDLYEWAQEKLTRRVTLPIMNIWGQTETGGGLVAGIPGIQGYRDDTMMRPLPGVELAVVKHDGTPVTEPDWPGALVLKGPFPSLCRELYKDSEAFRQLYWEKFKGYHYYATGDGAYFDDQKNLHLTGRLDHVLSYGTGRRSINEVESVISRHELVKECAAIIMDHPVHGYMLVAFVVLKDYKDESYSEETLRLIREHVIEESGEIALPDTIRFTKYLPKTHDNQINRQLLGEIAIQMEGI